MVDGVSPKPPGRVRGRPFDDSINDCDGAIGFGKWSDDDF
jgi:hypothetical protein